VNIINSKSETDSKEADDSEIDDVTDNVQFVGVASRSRTKSVLTYYGIENHSKWVFTPLFRGAGTVSPIPRAKIEEIQNQQ
jgi:hypothetical protein